MRIRFKNFQLKSWPMLLYMLGERVANYQIRLKFDFSGAIKKIENKPQYTSTVWTLFILYFRLYLKKNKEIITKKNKKLLIKSRTLASCTTSYLWDWSLLFTYNKTSIFHKCNVLPISKCILYILLLILKLW